MARTMKGAAVLTFLLTAVFALVSVYQEWATPFSITFGTFFYHFAMRLFVGTVFNRFMANKANYRRIWYQLRPFEAKLYQVLRVKKWKKHMPSYDASLFDPKLHSWEEIAQAMCQAELVHEVIALLSFLPVLAAIPFGAFPVFLITSVLSAGFDLCFVAMQRFNRPRIIKLIDKARTAQ